MGKVKSIRLQVSNISSHHEAIVSQIHGSSIYYHAGQHQLRDFQSKSSGKKEKIPSVNVHFIINYPIGILYYLKRYRSGFSLITWIQYPSKICTSRKNVKFYRTRILNIYKRISPILTFILDLEGKNMAVISSCRVRTGFKQDPDSGFLEDRNRVS